MEVSDTLGDLTQALATSLAKAHVKAGTITAATIADDIEATVVTGITAVTLRAYP